ncbi:hypothetical protein [Anaeromyxobacter diazotrophicus]|uniref:Uncharacterized protein n=1 Tax=Anaeromyxobacter diazotrophicus TaxID=2590199 RepID=A0A7I9VJQ7_9BACT|nr:hypothetical protein [Anaeromyxobacter diazotrophicus]GEJ56605.1 hypothetical protein AMYX_13460 [Anaeromyxobacter diazotrophicus]
MNDRTAGFFFNTVGTYVGKIVGNSRSTDADPSKPWLLPSIQWFIETGLGSGPDLETGGTFEGAKGTVRLIRALPGTEGTGELTVHTKEDGAPPSVTVTLWLDSERYDEVWSNAQAGQPPNAISVDVARGDAIRHLQRTDSSLWHLLWSNREHPTVSVESWQVFFHAGERPKHESDVAPRLTAETLRSEVRIKQPGFLGAFRYAAWALPFVIKLLVGFEWAVLAAVLVAAQEVSGMVRAVIADTTQMNLMKQHEHKLWPPE